MTEPPKWETLVLPPYRAIADKVAPAMYREIQELRAELARIKGAEPIGYLYTTPGLSKPAFITPELIEVGWELTNPKWTRFCAVYPPPK